MLSGLRAGRAATRLSLRSITRLVVCFKHPSIFHLALKSLSTMVKMQSLWLRPMMARHRDITRLISMQFYRQLSNSPPRLCPNPSKWRNSHNLVNTLPHASPNTFSLSKVSRFFFISAFLKFWIFARKPLIFQSLTRWSWKFAFIQLAFAPSSAFWRIIIFVALITCPILPHSTSQPGMFILTDFFVTFYSDRTASN